PGRAACRRRDASRPPSPTRHAAPRRAARQATAASRRWSCALVSPLSPRRRAYCQNRGMAEERVYGNNVFADDLPAFGDGVRGLRMERTDECPLVCAVWELDAGVTVGPYHLHHGTDELLIVLRGTATVRTPDGERELPAGGVLQFPRGLPGA